jgi:glutathione peroxidase
MQNRRANSNLKSFLQQEPGDNGTEILNSIKYVRPGGGFEPNFELTEKIDVNGPDEHPLFSFLKVNKTKC